MRNSGGSDNPSISKILERRYVCVSCRDFWSAFGNAFELVWVLPLVKRTAMATGVKNCYL